MLGDSDTGTVQNIGITVLRDVPATRSSVTQALLTESGRQGAGHVAHATAVLQTLFVVSIWLATRGYGGIRHDARIYIGRALADVKATDMGRDALFALDGQTHLTIYSLLTTPLVRLLGASTAAIVLTYATLIFWMIGAAWLAWRILPRRLIPSALVCAAAFPATYGPFGIFGYAEAMAVPRGLAEVCVLISLAALTRGWRSAACFAILLALGFHAPTALAGLCVLFIVAACETPILWWLAAAAFCFAAIGIGLFRFESLRFLFQRFDPIWLAINQARNPCLFETMWPSSAWSHVILSGTTLAIAAIFSKALVRQIIFATIITMAAGIFISYILGELPSNVFVLQLQTWRVLWLGKVLAILMIPFCAATLFSDKRFDSRLAIVFLFGSWYLIDDLLVVLLLSSITLFLIARSRFFKTDDMSASIFWILTLFGVGLALISAAGDIAIGWQLVSIARNAGAPLSAQTLLPFISIGSFLAAIAAVYLSIKPLQIAPIHKTLGFAAFVSVCLPLAMFLSDRRDPTHRMEDVGFGRDTLQRVLGPTPNGVVWLDNDTAPLFWALRPTWVNELQGTAGAFSRPLAVQWERRLRLLIDNGLATEHNHNPFRSPRNDFDPARVARGAVDICKKPDGPDAIVVPEDLATDIPLGIAKTWHTPEGHVLAIHAGPHGFSYVRRDRYSILRCADFR